MSKNMDCGGIVPTGYNVLVLPEQREEKTQGGIIIPDKTRERDQMAEETGVIVAMGELAFTLGTPGHDDYFVGAGRKMLGHQAIYQRYSGDLVEGNNGLKYRVMPASDIIAFQEEAQ